MAGAVYVTGDTGSRVAVYKRGRRYYLRAWHRGKNQPRYKACRTGDLEVAKSQARALARRLEDGDLSRGVSGYTLTRIFASYAHLRTPQKVSRYQSEDRRRAEMWKAYLGGATKPEQITLMDWERFQEDRRTGKIDARGVTGPPVAVGVSDPPLLRPRVIRGDLMWLRTVLRWAKAHGMIDVNPTDDWPLPSDPNPRRNMATEERLEAILKVAKNGAVFAGVREVPEARSPVGKVPQVTGKTRVDGQPLCGGDDGHRPLGYLYELLVLCAETGRRIGAVRQLRYGNLRLKMGPHGSICWPAETDKGLRVLGSNPSAPTSSIGKPARQDTEGRPKGANGTGSPSTPASYT